MTKTKILIIGIIVLLILSIGAISFILLQPQKATIGPKNKISVSSLQTYSSSASKNNFGSSKKTVLDPKLNTDDTQDSTVPQKFTDSKNMNVKEVDPKLVSKNRDESLIYADDFVSANCESYVLTVNSAQNCYITFRKEILDSEIPKIKAVITPVEKLDDSDKGESVLNCSLLSSEKNPDKNILACTTDNLNLKNSGNYNMTLTVADDTLTNTLEKNIEVLTVTEFQQKYNNQSENQDI